MVVSRVDVDSNGDYIRFDFTANAFLHHMVRNIVGALVRIGTHKAAPSWIAQLLQGRDRTLSAATFPADGLYLTGAEYESRWNLPPTRRPIELPLVRDLPLPAVERVS